MGRRAFTLVEVLVTVAIVAVAVVGVMGGIRALGAADARARDADLLQRLASQKMNEIVAVEDPRASDNNGSFQEFGYADVTWTLDVEPSGAENLDQVTVTATRGALSQTLTGLAFIRPVTGTATQ